MHKNLLAAGGLILLTALLGCGGQKVPVEASFEKAPLVMSEGTSAPVLPEQTSTQAPAATAAPAPEETEAPAPEWEGTCRSIVDELPYAVDLDMDGTAEVVDLRAVPGEDGYPRWAIVLTKGGAETLFQTDIPNDTDYGLWVGDLDEDGQNELFFHGDMASYDYLIYAFRCDLTPIPFAPDERAERWGGSESAYVYDGFIAGFEDDHLVVDGIVDMLGTHVGVRNFSIDEEGVIGPVSTVWAFIYEDYDDPELDRALTVKRELTAYRAGVRKDPGEPFTLSPGEKIYPLASDGFSRMWFETESGRQGVLLLTPDQESMWLIDGVPEADCFETLPYAG